MPAVNWHFMHGNAGLRLTLFAGANFTGRRIRFSRGSVAVRDMGALRFNNALTSFRLQNGMHGSNVTLVLFSRNNFRGNFRVFRGAQQVANLSARNFNNVTSSFILVGGMLSDHQVRQIRRTGQVPGGILVIKQ